MTQPQGAGGIISTVDDLSIWDKALYDSKLVSQSLLKKAFTRVTFGDNQSFNYGFGWILPQVQGIDSTEHNGNINGFFSYILRVPSQKVLVTVLTNGEHINPQCFGRRLGRNSGGQTR